MTTRGKKNMAVTEKTLYIISCRSDSKKPIDTHCWNVGYSGCDFTWNTNIYKREKTMRKRKSVMGIKNTWEECFKLQRHEHHFYYKPLIHPHPWYLWRSCNNEVYALYSHSFMLRGMFHSFMLFNKYGKIRFILDCFHFFYYITYMFIAHVLFMCSFLLAKVE